MKTRAAWLGVHVLLGVLAGCVSFATWRMSHLARGLPLADLQKAASLARSGSEAWAPIWLDQLPLTLGATGFYVASGAVLLSVLGSRCPLGVAQRLGALVLAGVVFATFRLPPPGLPFALFTGVPLLLGIPLVYLAEHVSAALARVVAAVLFSMWPFTTCTVLVTAAAMCGSLAGSLVDRLAPAAREGAG